MEDDKVDMKILHKMEYTIYYWEQQNCKTKKLSNQEMIDKIKKYIQQEIDRNDN